MSFGYKIKLGNICTTRFQLLYIFNGQQIFCPNHLKSSSQIIYKKASINYVFKRDGRSVKISRFLTIFTKLTPPSKETDGLSKNRDFRRRILWIFPKFIYVRYQKEYSIICDMLFSRHLKLLPKSGYQPGQVQENNLQIQWVFYCKFVFAILRKIRFTR